MTWSRTMRLHVAYFVTTDPPPAELVTSVRAVVLFGDTVLVMRNPDAVHALPGGRCELGEAFEDTLRRELREEAGIAIVAARPLGVVHLRHLLPREPGYAFLYPDFLWAVFKAEAESDKASVDDDYELEARFLPAADATREIDLGSRIFVAAATQ